MLDILSARREEVKDILASIEMASQRGDRTFTESLIQTIAEEQIDALVDVTLILVQLGRDTQRSIKQSDIVWAMEFIDHLDTLGKKIASKHDGQI